MTEPMTSRIRKINSITELETPEQPNTNALIVKTIQGLMTCVNDNLDKLPKHPPGITNRQHKNYDIVCKALEKIASFEKTELFDLQKAFE